MKRKFAFGLTFLLWAGFLVGGPVPQIPDMQVMGEAFESRFLPLMTAFCVDCHDGESKKGDLDLERFSSLERIREEPELWVKVLEQMSSGEMPPEKKPQPDESQRGGMMEWVQSYLDAEALAGAGDPGPVVLRRLNNDEYTYAIQDLTGLSELNPAREFPVDSAAGEGFINTGDAQSMSPALFEKYLMAAREVASHAVLLPDGFRFSPESSRSDWSNHIVESIRQFYRAILQTGDIDFSYQQSREVGRAEPLNDSEGRLNLLPYLQALVEHQSSVLQDPSTAAGLARTLGLNEKYFSRITKALFSEDSTGPSDLLAALRKHIGKSATHDLPVLLNWIQAWQNQLWRFDGVGHLGEIRPWQNPVNPLSESHAIQIKLPRLDSSHPAHRVIMRSTDLTGGRTNHGIRWVQPKIMSPVGTFLYRDLAHIESLWNRTHDLLTSGAGKILNHIRFDRAGLDMDEGDSIMQRRFVQSFRNYLGPQFAQRNLSAEAFIERLSQPVREVGGNQMIQGWTRPGAADLSFLSNASDTTWHIPGEVPPKSIVVHPRPERWIAVAWKCPTDMEVSISARVHDRHGCGNGVRWVLDHRSGRHIEELGSGTVNPVQEASILPITSHMVRSGDLISLVIDSRDGNHSCDLTQIDLEITELADANRRWLLSEDCASTISAGNPHPGGHGHPDTWHFYSGTSDDRMSAPGFPRGSILDRWIQARSDAEAHQLAQEFQALLARPIPQDLNGPDNLLWHQFNDFSGDFYRFFNLRELAEETSPSKIISTILPEGFTMTPDGDIVGSSQSEIELSIPAHLGNGAEFMVSGVAHSLDVMVQFHVSLEGTSSMDLWDPDAPVIVANASPGYQRLVLSFDHFRDLFPKAMCYARVVPIDEVVTLILYHREDEAMKRLMLNEDQVREIDHLWNELRYVSQDAFQLEITLEQILEFATQDADPSRFFPMRNPVARRSLALSQWLEATEPAHLDELIHFASRAWRRPLTVPESHGLRAFYHQLRQDDFTHEDAFRLTLSRLLSAPEFLYRDEFPSQSAEATTAPHRPVAPLDLASRLSFFLWSSIPDTELINLALSGRIHEPHILRAQVRRMLQDPKARRLAIQFACQWLHIRNFDQFNEKNENLFPEFAQLRSDFYEESIQYFLHFFQNNESVLSILQSDFTYVNPALAAFYGFGTSPVSGWHRVDGIHESGRRGILGMGAILASNSGASRTSPILRGNWISETLLGEKLPRPPANVPQLPELPPTGLTEREMIEKHSSDPTCARCHARIDPYGFSLEAFDTIGRRRPEDDYSSRATLPDGFPVDGLEDLTEYLASDRREAFLRNFCTKLLGFALGRSHLLSDKPLIDSMVDQLETDQFRVQTAIDAIVTSDQFRHIRVP